ncbi:putative Zn finger protein [Salinibacterium sp. CAN_S4]|uniref:zinc-ribbon domain-containing protein n=1 Tax=Salinibacterium sp. CAN_S4 TaxID=2787727 RepID=UPI0018F0298F
MLLIFGTRAYNSVVVIVFFACSHCGVEARQHVMKTRNRVTLFFVPLFSLSTSFFVWCENCGASTALTSQQAAHSVEWAASQRA